MSGHFSTNSSKLIPRNKTGMQSTLGIVLSIFLLSGSSLWAQTPPSKEDSKKDKSKQAIQSLLPQPVIVINVASVERILQNIDLIFELAERPEIAEIASASLANVNDLEGLDQNKNLGVEMYLKTGLLPQPVFISYFPITKIRTFIETLEAMIPGEQEQVINQDPNHDDLIILDTNGGKTFIRIQETYAHLLFGSEESDLITSQDFGDPTQQFQRLTDAYDLAIKLDLNSIPELLRTTFLGFFRTAIETQLQQRDGEPDSAYQIRRMGGKQNLDGIEYLLSEGQELLLGFDVDTEQKRGFIDFLIKARPNSELAREIKNIPGKTSYFNVVTSRENLPIAVSISMNIGRRERKAYSAYLSFFEKQLTEKLMTEDERSQNTNSIKQFFSPVISMVEKGHLDLFTQLVATPNKKFALIGGIKVAPSANLPTALLDLIERVNKLPGNEARIFTNAETVQRVALHQLQPDVNSADDRQRRFLGGVPSLYIGADSQVIWFAMGTDIAVSALNEAIEQIKTASPEARKEQRTAPLQAEFHIRPWLSLFSEEEIEQSGVMRVLNVAFSNDNDLVLLKTQPTETGVRTRIEFDEGYLKLLGLSISKRFDRNQERRDRRKRDQEKKKAQKAAPGP